MGWARGEKRGLGGVVPPDGVTADRPALHLRRRLLGVGLGFAAWVGFRLLSSYPSMAEAVASTGPLPELARILSVATGRVPFALAEALVLLFLLRQGMGLARGVSQLRAGKDRLPRTFARGGLRLAQDIGVLVFLFYVLWGFQYARAGLDGHLGIASTGEVSASEIQPLALRAIERTNELYREIHGSPDAGHPTASPPIEVLVSGLEEGWIGVRAALDLPLRMERTHGGPKSFLATPLMKRLGVGGMYFPFTAEALVLGDLPGALLAKSLAHEMAHQRGIASESDANVLAFLVARESPDPVARYSAYIFLQQQLVRILQSLASEESEWVVGERYPGVRRDLVEAHAYWEPARGAAGAAATRVNDVMLRSHGVADGVGSYRGSVWILVALARDRGESALF